MLQKKARHMVILNKLSLLAVNVILLIALIALATLMGKLFKNLNFHESNIIITYLLAVLLISYWIEGYFYGVMASVLGVLTFNFFFTEPYYSLLAYRQDYPITFAIMLFAAVLVSTITSKMKRESQLSKIREKRTYVLYRLAQGLLKAQNASEVCDIVGNEVSSVLNVAVHIVLQGDSEHEPYDRVYKQKSQIDEEIFISDQQRALAQSVFTSRLPARYKKQYFDDMNFFYVPIVGQNEALGYFGVSLKPEEFLYEEKVTLINAMTSQIGMALDRIDLGEAQKQQHMAFESERFRSNLLRAISHDLRTPLTGILGAATTLSAHENLLDNVQRRSLVEDIAEDARWLIQSVENILSMTKFDEGKVQLHKAVALVDDLLLEALDRFKGSERKIVVDLPEKIVSLEVDGHLIEQVIVNLVDNALKYTPSHTTVHIQVVTTQETVVFKVIDEGPGIQEDHIPLLFNRFFTAGISSDRGKNGIGLGLEICKSIVEAHNGKISAHNNPNGGACFEFELPLTGGVLDEF